MQYRIMAFKDFVPDKLRFLILLCSAIIYQFSNCIYLTNLNEVVGDKALTNEDIKCAVSASFVGMTMIFPLLFRIKFRFTSRTILLSVSAIIIVGNVICMHSNNILILTLVSFIVGAVRMIGMFECMSSIQLIITPKRDFTVFFSVIYLIVLGSIQFSGLLTAQISYLYSWKYMYILIVGLLLMQMTAIYFLMRPIRLMRKFPLYQIDWMGIALWTLPLMLINFIFEYGQRLDWFDSFYIRIAVIATIVLLILAVQRMYGIRRPFIMPEVFKYKNLLLSLLLIAILQIFLTTSNVILNAYTGGILHYDILHNASLNWMVFGGVLFGAGYAFYWMSVYRGRYKSIFFIGFLSFVLYHFILYFTIQPSIAKEDLYLPYFLKGFGYVSLYISIALYAAEGIPFPHFFPSITVMGFARSAIGGTMANSLCANLLQYLQKKNRIVLSQNIDLTNPASDQLFQEQFKQAVSSGFSNEQAQMKAAEALYGLTNMQASLLTWKEIFGIITIFGIFVLLGLLFIPYIRPTFRQLPKIKNIWRYMRGKAYTG